MAGIEVTVFGTIASAVVALLVAFLAGLARLSPSWPLRAMATVYVEVFRGASTVVLLFWAFYVLPSAGVQIPALAAGIGVLGLNAGAYASEIVRGAVLSVPRGQWEAASALHLSRARRMWSVILPQAVPTMIPSFGNVLIDILKGTSLFSLVTITDLTFAVNQLTVIGAAKLAPAYTFLLIMYFVLSVPLMGIVRLSERLASVRAPV
ncbi:MAG: amino acid ABC transporter permease [Candidatus Dormibacteria bacterium]